MIDSGMFSKKDIIDWEDEDKKTWAAARLVWELTMEEEDTYTAVLGGTAKRTHFESAQNTIEESRDDHEEQAEEDVLTNNDLM